MNNSRTTIPITIERMLLRIGGYNLDLKYVKGIENIADYTNRLPSNNLKSPINNSNESYVNFMPRFSVPNALTIEDIKIETLETLRNEFLQYFSNIIRSGHWYIIDENEKYA